MVDEHPYSVVNGKIMRSTATARVEITPTEAAKLLNNLTRQIRDERDDRSDRGMSWQEATS